MKNVSGYLLFFLGSMLLFSAHTLGYQIKLCNRDLSIFDDTPNARINATMDVILTKDHDAINALSSEDTYMFTNKKDIVPDEEGLIDHCFFALIGDSGEYVDTFAYFYNEVRAEYPAVLAKFDCHCELIYPKYSGSDNNEIKNMWEEIKRTLGRETMGQTYTLTGYNCCTAARNTCATLGLTFPFTLNSINCGCGLNKGCCCGNCSCLYPSKLCCTIL